jgi:hypothetical protein
MAPTLEMATTKQTRIKVEMNTAGYVISDGITWSPTQCINLKYQTPHNRIYDDEQWWACYIGWWSYSL